MFHQTVKKVSSDFESLGFNTAISQMMIFVNACYKQGSCPKAYAEDFVKMLSCICPHIGEEMWQILGHDESLALEPWPAWDAEKIREDTIQKNRCQGNLYQRPDRYYRREIKILISSPILKHILLNFC